MIVGVIRAAPERFFLIQEFFAAVGRVLNVVTRNSQFEAKERQIKNLATRTTSKCIVSVPFG
jgi:hypothetical protein